MMRRCLLGLLALAALGCGETPAPSARSDELETGASAGAGAFTGSGANPGAGAVAGNDSAGNSGASGTSGTGGSSGSSGAVGNTPVTFNCDESAKGPEASLRRLTMGQYRNTVRDLVAWLTNDDPDVVAAVTQALEGLPEDRREPVPQDLHGSYRRLDQTL